MNTLLMKIYQFLLIIITFNVDKNGDILRILQKITLFIGQL